MGHMHADLVGASGFKPALHKGRRAEILNDAHASDGMAPPSEQHRLTLPVGFVAGQHRRDLKDIAGLKTGALNPTQPRVRGTRHPVAQRKVTPVNRVFFKLFGKSVVGCVGFGNHQQATGILVDTVHDAWAFFAAHAR